MNKTRKELIAFVSERLEELKELEKRVQESKIKVIDCVYLYK